MTEQDPRDEHQIRALFVFEALESLGAALKARGMSQPEFQDTILAYSIGLAHELGQTEPEFVERCAGAAAVEWSSPSLAERQASSGPLPDTSGRPMPRAYLDNRARLDTERRCRALADKFKAELLPHNQGFVLIVFDYEGGSAQNLSYIATLNRNDAARLLTGLTDHWLDRDGIGAEPSIHTATMLRELVSQMGPLDLQNVQGHEGRVQNKGRRAEGLAAHLEAAAQHLACFQRDQQKLGARREVEN